MLSPAQINSYRNDGYLISDSGIETGDLRRVRDEVSRLEGLDHPGRVLEKDGRTVRGIHGCHRVSELFARLVRLPRLLSAARLLLDDDVYVHQLKVNTKRALHGDVWPWHQDYVFWQQKDGMREPRVVNVAIFLDEATEHNGPLLLLPGSHTMDVPQNIQDALRSGRDSENAAAGASSGNGSGVPKKPDWVSQLSADLDFRLTAEQLVSLVEDRGIRSATGPAGGLLFFDSRIVHGSGTNMSPFDRKLALITYNSVSNGLVEVAAPRPEFLAAREFRALTPLAGEL